MFSVFFNRFFPESRPRTPGSSRPMTSHCSPGNTWNGIHSKIRPNFTPHSSCLYVGIPLPETVSLFPCREVDAPQTTATNDRLVSKQTTEPDKMNACHGDTFRFAKVDNLSMTLSAGSAALHLGVSGVPKPGPSAEVLLPARPNV
jgi:hypothetical protein